jgi:YfiH family protein
MKGWRIGGETVPYLYHEATSAQAPHGFFGAAGGVSTGLYNSLNCGYGSADDPTCVTQNRSRVATAMGLTPDRMAAVFQVHGPDVVIASEGAGDDRDRMARADGLVTTCPGLGLSILTADCLPLLLVDNDSAVIGACHAGWRGAAAGIVTRTVSTMRTAGAGTITALIGPTIRQTSYQIGVEMRDEVLARIEPALRDRVVTCFGASSKGKLTFDLAGLVRAQLDHAGIDAIHDCGIDTYTSKPGISSDSPGFFSHRRATHAVEPDCGRQIAVISLPPSTV